VARAGAASAVAETALETGGAPLGTVAAAVPMQGQKAATACGSSDEENAEDDVAVGDDGTMATMRLLLPRPSPRHLPRVRRSRAARLLQGSRSPTARGFAPRIWYFDFTRRP
jgi:hypothetical protein